MTPTVSLRAGDLDVLYEDGALRMVRFGPVEVLRAVTLAVRDADWLTVPGVILNERVVESDLGFSITYERRYDWNGIIFEAHCLIVGDTEGISFEMRGTALSAFRKNRIGLCVLHPLCECAGKDCRIVTVAGKTLQTRFPEEISPHQPFQDLCGMHWRPAPGCEASLEFEGEVFEAEDQRNWTDASFKTYGTPLALPFPAEVQEGERFEQRVTLRFHGDRPWSARSEVVTFAPLPRPPRPLPPLGLGHSAGGAGLSTLGLSHLRADLRLWEGGWADAYEVARREAASLGLPLELAVFFGPEPEHEWESLRGALAHFPAPICSVLLLHRDFKVTPPGLIERLVPRLRQALPGVLVGGGTDAYFAELNRDRPASPALDFLCFSANPQVHAEDDRTLLENVSALADVVRSARAFAGRRAIHVSPLTLKPRGNPDATSGPPGVAPVADPRRGSLLEAAWALGSVKHLLEAGVDSLTFGEVAGGHSPLYFVLREVWGRGPWQVIPLAEMTRRRDTRGWRACFDARFLALCAVGIVPVAGWVALVFARTPNPTAKAAYYAFQEPGVLLMRRLYQAILDRFLLRDCGPVAAALAACGAWAAWSRKVDARPAIVWMGMGVGFMLLLAPKTLTHDYYELMAVPGLCMFGALGWDALRARAASRHMSHRRRVWAGGAIVTAVVVIHSPWIASMKFEQNPVHAIVARRMDQLCSPSGKIVVIGQQIGWPVVHYSGRLGWILQDATLRTDWREALLAHKARGAEFVALYFDPTVPPAHRKSFLPMAEELPVVEHGEGPWFAKGKPCEYFILSLGDLPTTPAIASGTRSIR